MNIINSEDVLRLFPQYRYYDFSPAIQTDPLYTVIVPDESIEGLLQITFEKLQDHVVESIATVEHKDGFVPKFEEFDQFRPGTFLVKCANERSKLWLKLVAEMLEVPGHAKLKAVAVKDIFVKPVDRLYLGYVVMTSEQGNFNLDVLRRLNPQIHFSNWRILDMGRFYADGLKKYQVYLEIPGSSIIPLQECKCTLDYGLERIQIMIVNIPNLAKLGYTKVQVKN
ncbi:hypothetical protein TKK_0004927 [Trichogramma kaykai]